MDAGNLITTLTLDNSGFSEGIGAASDALSSFATVAAGVFAGGELIEGLQEVMQGFQNLATSILATASQIEEFSATAGFSLNDTAETFNATVAAFSAGAATSSASAAEATNDLIKYNEKIKEINDNIATVMAGTNITDALAKYNQTLEDDQQAYADKVDSINQQITDTQEKLLQTEQDNAQRMQDTLSDMESSEADKRADKQESQAQQLAATTSATAKAALQKKFNDENQLEADSYNRAYETKQAELQRNLDEENTKAQDAANKQIATLQDQLTKEAALEADKEAKLKTQLDDEVAKDKEANDKKLAQYKQELADEERAWELSQQKKTSGGSTSGNVMGTLRVSGQASNDWGTMGEKVADINQEIDKLSQTTPFTKMELEQAAQRADNVGINFQKIGPVLADLGAAKGVGPFQTLEAIIMATHGRTMQLRNQFGITADTLNYVLGKAAGNTKFSFNEVLEGIKGVNDQAGYTGAAEAMGNTYTGQLNKVNSKIQDTLLGLVGINAVTGKVDPNGLFAILLKGIADFSDYLDSHKGQITEIINNISTAIINLGKWLNQNKEVFQVDWGIITYVVKTAWGFIKEIFDGIKVAFDVLKLAIDLFSGHWKDIWGDIKNIFSDVVDFFKDGLKALAGIFTNIGDAIMGSHINPKAHGSPSLVEEVLSGVAQIKNAYGSLNNIALPSLSGMTGGISGIGGSLTGGVGNYNTQTNNRTSNVAMNNYFNVNNEASADNVAQYMAFLLEKKGVV
jgi:phage-related protein